MHYSPTEMMTIAAAREIRDGEVVFVGMRLPLLAFAVAKATHAPSAVGLFECGLVRDVLPDAPIQTMADPPNVQGASWAGSLATLMGLMAQGHVHLGLLGGAQVDRFGNLNSSFIGPYSAPARRLPGSGGASDIAALAQRTVITMPHEPRRLVEAVDFLTSPGYGTGEGWREGVGLPPRPGPQPYGGPAAVVTTLGVLRPTREGPLLLTTLFPGATLDEAQAQCGWPLHPSAALDEAAPPTPEELAALRRLAGAG